MHNLSYTTSRLPWLFFDLDDTIWNFTKNSEASLTKIYEISPILRKLFKQPQEFFDIYHHNNFILWDLYSRGEVSTKDLKNERWRRTLATKQFEVLTAICEELERNYLDILAKSTIETEGVVTLLSGLQKKAMLAVISNGFSQTQYKKLHYSGLERFITRVIVSEEIGINKPNKAIFDYAVSETGALPPFIYVGDHPTTDILGAMKAGWYACWVNLKQSEFPLSEAEMLKEGINPDLFLGESPSLSQTLPAIENFINHIWLPRQYQATSE